MFDSFGKIDSANIETMTAAENLNSEKKVYHFDRTAKGQKKMDRPGEPIVADILKSMQQSLEDLDISLENDNFGTKGAIVSLRNENAENVSQRSAK